jgi:hypothetical protein
MIKCGPELKGQALPSGYNAAVMKVKRLFTEEVKHRQAELRHSLSLTVAQRYVLREIRLLFSSTTDEDLKAQLNILERAFRSSIAPAINRELNFLRRNGVTREELFRSLINIYHEHNMKERLDNRNLQTEDKPIPKIVCSESLL